MSDRDETAATGYRHTPGNDRDGAGGVLDPIGGGGVGTPGGAGAVGGDDASIIGGTVGGSPGGGNFDAAEAYTGGDVDPGEGGGLGTGGPGTGAAGSRIGDDQNASAGAVGADLGPLRRGDRG